MSKIDVISKTVNKHAKGLYRVRLTVGGESEANNIISPMLSSFTNKHIGEFLNLEKISGNSNSPTYIYEFKSSLEDIKLCIDSYVGTSKAKLRVLLLPDVAANAQNEWLDSLVRRYKEAS